MIYIKKFSLLLCTLSFVACSTITIIPSNKPIALSPPKYSKTHNYFFWGLMGEKYINTKRICRRKRVRQMQTQFTFVNSLLTLLTLGIYSPKTAKVWCSN